VVDPQFEAEALLDQVMELEAQRYRTEFLLRATQSEYQTLESELNRIMPGLSRILSSNDDETLVALRQRITEAQLDNAELLSKNPDLRQNPVGDYERNLKTIADFTKQLADLSTAYSEEVIGNDRILLGQNTESAFERVADLQVQLIEKRIEITGAQARQGVLDQQLEVYRRQIDQIPNKAVLLARVQRDMETSAQLYTTVFQSLQEARIAEESDLGYVDIIDQAEVPSEPISPTIPLNLLLGSVLGGLLGVVAAFVRSGLDNRVNRPEDLRTRSFAVLGIIPDMRKILEGDFDGKSMVDVGGKQISTSLVTVLTPLSQASESFRRLRTNMDFSAPDSTKKTVLVTSPEPGEGKTSSSLNLAVANAQLGRKTLFLDADLRRPMSHRLMGLTREPGLVDWLFDESVRNYASLTTHIEDLHVLTVGKAAPNPSELLGSRRMKELMAELSRYYDTRINPSWIGECYDSRSLTGVFVASIILALFVVLAQYLMLGITAIRGILLLHIVILLVQGFQMEFSFAINQLVKGAVLSIIVYGACDSLIPRALSRR
jgi:succinoglycan biosynthesis transport protein ExoP